MNSVLLIIKRLKDSLTFWLNHLFKKNERFIMLLHSTSSIYMWVLRHLHDDFAFPLCLPIRLLSLALIYLHDIALKILLYWIKFQNDLGKFNSTLFPLAFIWNKASFRLEYSERNISLMTKIQSKFKSHARKKN